MFYGFSVSVTYFTNLFQNWKGKTDGGLLLKKWIEKIFDCIILIHLARTNNFLYIILPFWCFSRATGMIWTNFTVLLTFWCKMTFDRIFISYVQEDRVWVISVEPLRDEGWKYLGTVPLLLNQTWIFISIENITGIVIKLDDSWNDIIKLSLFCHGLRHQEKACLVYILY